MKFNIRKFFFKIVLKFFKNIYIDNQIKWGKGNLNFSVFFMSFDFETQKDIDVIESLTKSLIKVGIHPYFAVPGELIENNKSIFKKISHKCTIINHGYKIHTKFCKKTESNFSTLSYSNLSRDLIIEDIIRGHDSIKNNCNQISKIFRIPHFGEFSEKFSIDFIYSILSKLGYVYSSSTTPIFSFLKKPIYKIDKILELPSSSYINNPLQIIDSWSINNSELTYEDLLAELDRYEELMNSHSIFFNIYFDPSDIINQPHLFEKFLRFSKFQKRIENKRLIK